MGDFIASRDPDCHRSRRSSRQVERPFFWPEYAVETSHGGVGFPSRASEFPHDNAEISSGAVWICDDLTGAAMPQLAPEPLSIQAQPAFEPVGSESFVLYFDDDDVCADEPVNIDLDGTALSVTVFSPERQSDPELESSPQLGAAGESPSAPAASPAFQHFQSALSAALLAQGATRSAALVPQLLRLESIPADSLSKEVLLTLQSRGYLDGNARYSSKYRELCGAWCAVLQGSSQDFAACGTTTLDRFGADLLAALLAVPATRSDELRRSLRKAGIAAFGVLDAA